ncbi:hypothetical protein HDU78_003012 [Chytriomyces hyalinus]|nr:hypothetical protein HDU78_003012 [Chytriomyces hyalinus]
MGNMFVKMPTVGELRNAKPTIVNPSVQEPQTFFNIPLRTLVLVLLALFAIMEIVGLAQSIPYAGSNGIFWFFIAFDLFGLVLDVVGFFAVYRLIPEYMIAYGWALMALLVVNVIRFITWAVLGSFVGASVTLILQVLFTFSMVGCMYSLRAYALSCRGIAI